MAHWQATKSNPQVAKSIHRRQNQSTGDKINTQAAKTISSPLVLWPKCNRPTFTNILYEYIIKINVDFSKKILMSCKLFQYFSLFDLYYLAIYFSKIFIFPPKFFRILYRVLVTGF